MRETDLPQTDFKHLEESIRQKLAIEIMHNFGMIDNRTYYTTYSTNAETLDRDYKIWEELQVLEEKIDNRK